MLTMSRADWDRLVPDFGKPIQLDVAATPMREVRIGAVVVGAMAQQSSSGTGEITIVRHDAKDEPTPYNLDKYTVWTVRGVIRFSLSSQDLLSRMRTWHGTWTSTCSWSSRTTDRITG